MNSSASAVRREVFQAPADQMSLWADSPVLTPHSSGYLGRVTLEVWSDGAVNSVGNPSRFGNVLGILQHADVKADVTAVPVTSNPILSSNGEAEFLGRVIVEFWKDGAEAAVVGSDRTLLVEHAIKGLGGHLVGS